MFPLICLTFNSLKLSLCHFPSFFLSIKLKGRHHFLPAEKANIPTKEYHGWRGISQKG